MLHRDWFLGQAFRRNVTVFLPPGTFFHHRTLNEPPYIGLGPNKKCPCPVCHWENLFRANFVQEALEREEDLPTVSNTIEYNRIAIE